MQVAGVLMPEEHLAIGS